MNIGKLSIIRFTIIISSFLLTIKNSNAQSPVFEWVKSIGGSSYDYANSIAVDKEGNVYTTGIFHSDTAFGNFGSSSHKFISNGAEDIFLIKQNPAGELIWAKSFGGSFDDYSSAIAVDDSGNVFITGSFVGTVDLDPGPGQEIHTSVWGTRMASPDFFISKFNSSGNLVWVRVAGGSGGDQGNAIVVDPSSNTILVTGMFGGDIQFNLKSGPVILTAQSYDPFILKVSNNGDLIWVKPFNGDSGGEGLGIAVDSLGYVYTVGNFNGAYDFDPDANNTEIRSSIGIGISVFISKLDATGKFVWVKTMGGPGSAGGNAIALDKFSNIYLTGYFGGIANFDPNGSFPLTSVGGLSDIFIAKLDKDGNFKWAKSAGSTNFDVGKAIALDELGNVYSTGHFYEGSRVDFNPGLKPSDTFNLTSNGNADLYIWKLNNDGEFVWAMNIGGKLGGDAGLGIKVKNGSVYTTGAFQSSVNFDPIKSSSSGVLSSIRYEDIFILKLIDCASFIGSEIKGPDSICINGKYTYSYNAPGALSYIWELPGDWIGQSDSNSISVLSKGSGMIKVTAVGKCDTVTQYLNVELSMPKVSINVNGFLLGTTNNKDYSTWQWYQDGVKISGATDSNYTVLENGMYSVVVVGNKNCVDTAFYLVTNVSIKDHVKIANSVHIFPNPTNNIIHINSPILVNLLLANIEGKVIYKIKKASQLTLNDLSEGVYFLQIYNLDGNLIKVEKIIKTK